MGLAFKKGGNDEAFCDGVSGADDGSFNCPYFGRGGCEPHGRDDSCCLCEYGAGDLSLSPFGRAFLGEPEVMS